MRKNILSILLLIFLLLVSGCTTPQPPPLNNPPNVPSNPNPPDGATGVVINPILSWECYDPDGDTLVFDIYLGTNPLNLLKIKEYHKSTSYQLNDLDYNTTYYWKIVAKDGKGWVIAGPIWSFTTQNQGQTNNPPEVPSNPNPPNGAQDVPATTPIISWQCYDPDGDMLMYDIYLGTNQNNLQKIKANHSNTSYQLQNLNLNTTYYWKIVAKDVKGAQTEGPVWNFTTTKLSDVEKAKRLVADLRNTILTIHDYKGIGVPGIVDTPFYRLSEELQEKIVPDLTETVQRIGIILNYVSQIPGPGNYEFDIEDYKLILSYHPTYEPNTDATLSFRGYKKNNLIDEGSLVIHYNDHLKPTSGNLNATMKTKDGNLVISGGYTATTLPYSEWFDTITITGMITSPYVTIDFSQAGRKLYADFGEWCDKPNNRYLPYLENLQINGQITTTTAQAEGALNVDAIHVEYPNGNTNNIPTTVEFDGTFREIKDGHPTGACFIGTVVAQYLNASQYNPYESYGPNNYPQWFAEFKGQIEAPNRPSIVAELNVTHNEYQIYQIQVGYKRKNPDGSEVWLKTLETDESTYNEYTKELKIILSNQDGLFVVVSVDWKKSGDDMFEGAILKDDLVTELADLYLMNGIPMVRYSDGYIESIF